MPFISNSVEVRMAVDRVFSSIYAPTVNAWLAYNGRTSIVPLIFVAGISPAEIISYKVCLSSIARMSSTSSNFRKRVMARSFAGIDLYSEAGCMPVNTQPPLVSPIIKGSFLRDGRAAVIPREVAEQGQSPEFTGPVHGCQQEQTRGLAA